MSKNQWQDLMGNTDFSPARQAADDESAPLNFDQLATIASTKEASEDDSEFYSGVFAPAKTSTFHAFLKTADAAPGAAYDFQVGDEVQARSGGSMFEGTIEAINGDKIKIRSTKAPKAPPREFDRSIVKPMTVVEEEKAQQQKQFEEEQEQQTVQIKHDLAEKVDVSNPHGSYAALVSYLQRVGYTLRLETSPDIQGQAKSHSYETRAAEYSEWTGGEELTEECVRDRPKHPGRGSVGGWILTFPFSPEVKNLIPFPMYSSVGGHPSRAPQALCPDGKTVRIEYTEAIKELVKAGLRMQCAGSTQEVRVSSSYRVKKGSSEHTVLKIAVRHLLAGPTDKDYNEATRLLAKRGLAWDAKAKAVFADYTPEETEDPSKMKWLPYRKQDGQLYWMDAYGVEHKYESAKKGSKEVTCHGCGKKFDSTSAGHEFENKWFCDKCSKQASKTAVTDPSSGKDVPELNAKGAAQSMPEKGSPEWHELEIAILWIKRNPAQFAPNAPMTPPSIAAKILAKYGLVWDEGADRPVKKSTALEPVTGEVKEGALPDLSKVVKVKKPAEPHRDRRGVFIR